MSIHSTVCNSGFRYVWTDSVFPQGRLARRLQRVTRIARIEQIHCGSEYRSLPTTSMPRALIVTEAPVVPEPYRLGLLACGFSVVDEIDDPQRLVKRAVAIEPEVIVIASQTPSQKLFESTRALDTHAPHAVMLFTAAIDHASIDAAARAGVHAYIVDGFSARRLMVQIDVARALQGHARPEIGAGRRRRQAGRAQAGGARVRRQRGKSQRC